MIRTSIARALTAFFAIFPTVFKTYEPATDVFAQKKFSKDIFNSGICYTET